MDIEKLIDGLKNSKGPDNCHDCALGYWAFMGATAFSTLRAENAQLRGELEYEQEHANAYYKECGQWEAENEKLRDKLERVTAELNDLRAQWDMYGGDEGITATYAELERVKAERDAAVEDLLDAAITPCSYCERNPNNGGACDMDNDNHEMFSCWKWRGIEED